MISDLLSALQREYNKTPIEFFNRYHVYRAPESYPYENNEYMIDYWYNEIMHGLDVTEQDYEQLTKGTLGYRVWSIHELYKDFTKFSIPNKKFKYELFRDTIRNIILNHNPIKLECFQFPEMFTSGHIIVCLYKNRDGNDKLSYVNPLMNCIDAEHEQQSLIKCANDSRILKIFHLYENFRYEFDKLYRLKSNEKHTDDSDEI